VAWWYAAVAEAYNDAWFKYSLPPRSRPSAPKKQRRSVAYWRRSLRKRDAVLFQL
jgi:hypothetical protein